MMDLEEFEQSQKRLMTIAIMAKTINTENMLAAIDAVERMGSVVDNNLFLKGQDNLRSMKNLVEAIQQVQVSARTLMDSVLRTNASDNLPKQVTNIMDLATRRIKAKDSCI